MQYYSEMLNKLFKDEADLHKAEAEMEAARKAEEEEKNRKAMERKVRAEEIEVARTEMKAAQKKYNTLLSKFVEDFGSYHATYTNKDVNEFDSEQYTSLFEDLSPLFGLLK